MAQRHGRARATTALHLDYTRLKKPLPAPVGLGPARSGPADFLELLTPSASPMTECVVEVDVQPWKDARRHERRDAGLGRFAARLAGNRWMIQNHAAIEGTFPVVANRPGSIENVACAWRPGIQKTEAAPVWRRVSP